MQKNHPDTEPVPDAPGNIARATRQAPPKDDCGSGRREARRPTTAQVTRDFACRDARSHAAQVCRDRGVWWIMDRTITRYSYHPPQTVTLETIGQRYDLPRETRRDIIPERSSLVRCPTLQWARGG